MSILNICCGRDWFPLLVGTNKDLRFSCSWVFRFLLEFLRMLGRSQESQLRWEQTSGPVSSHPVLLLKKKEQRQHLQHTLFLVGNAVLEHNGFQGNQTDFSCHWLSLFLPSCCNSVPISNWKPQGIIYIILISWQLLLWRTSFTPVNFVTLVKSQQQVKQML